MHGDLLVIIVHNYGCLLANKPNYQIACLTLVMLHLALVFIMHAISHSHAYEMSILSCNSVARPLQSLFVLPAHN